MGGEEGTTRELSPDPDVLVEEGAEHDPHIRR
jgi:hypothetical protein